MVQKVETLIVGAGLIGSSVAMHLAKRGMTQIRVIDFDLEGSLSSSELNAGGVRATWNHPLNIEMAQLSIEYFAKIANEVGYKSCGYLWLHPESRFQAAQKSRDLQIKLGWLVEEWDLTELKRKVPFIDKTEGIAGVMFSPRDGLINSNLLKNHYRAEAKKKGVIFDDRTVLRKAHFPQDGFTRVQLSCERFEESLESELKSEIVESFAKEKEMGRTRVEYVAQRVINCAGPWAKSVARILRYESPSYPVRRQVCLFDCPSVDLTPYGMIVDPSGVYFHPEATYGLAGFATPREPIGYNFEYGGEEFFNEQIWPALYERSSAFERIKHLKGWAGLYEVSPDESGIIGSVSSLGGHGSTVYEAHSFSGHGVMQSYGAGLLLAEKIILGKYETLDGELLSGSRFQSGKLLSENLII